MNGEDLLEAMSFVDEKYIHEAEQHVKRKSHWLRYSAIAASFCLIAAGALGWYSYVNLTRYKIAPAALTGDAIPEIAYSGAVYEDYEEARDTCIAANIAINQLTAEVRSIDSGKLTAVVLEETDGYPAGTEITVLIPEDTPDMAAGDTILVTFQPESTENSSISATKITIILSNE